LVVVSTCAVSFHSVHGWQAVEKRPSAALCSSLVFAAYEKYASFLMILRALHLNVFEQPVKKIFSTNSQGLQTDNV
jgi:hypothetical protein